MSETAGYDFFISYTGVDSPWAEWIAATLEEAGFTVRIQALDFRPGTDFVHQMHQATGQAKRTIAVLSPNYLVSEFGEAEWRVAFAGDPSGEQGLLIPVRVEPCEPPGLLRTRIAINLMSTDEGTARERLLAGVAPGREPGSAGRPGQRPTAGERPRFPGEQERSGRGSGRQHERSGRGAGSANDRADGGGGPVAEPWGWLSGNRELLGSLLGDDADLVGHRQPQQTLRSLLGGSDTAALVVLAGPSGSGKSSLTRWLRRIAGDRVVDVRAALRQVPTLRDDGSDVKRLLRELRPAVTAAGDRAVLVYDDVDHQLRDQGITRFVRDAIAELDLGFLVLTIGTPLTPQLFPIPVTVIRLDRRRVAFDDFDAFLDRVLDAAGVEPDAFSEDLRWSLHDMSEQTSDFQAVQYVVEMLLAHHQWTGDATHPAVLRRLLGGDPKIRTMQLPAVRARKGPRLTFRRKDKSELLTEVLLRHFSEPRELTRMAGRNLDSFDEEGFLEEAAQSMHDAVMSLCLTYSPRDLVLKLLEPEVIRKEIDLLKLDPDQLVDEREEEASLLIRGLGFTLVDTPKGLSDFKDAVQDARALVEDQGARTEVLNGAGVTVIQHVEAALLDLLHFWATYLYGSERELVKLVNTQGGNDGAMDGNRLTTSDIVRLLRFLDTSAEPEESAYRLSFPEGHVPVSPVLLEACEKFAKRAESFRPATRSSGAAAGNSHNFRIRCRGLVDAAADVLRASDDSFPTVIKLSEIVFDEYSRTIFRGVDSDEKEVRFALTDNEDREDLVVAAHYFMLPKRPVSVNPHIVPRGGGPARVLFDRAQAYENASTTQRDQGNHLIELVTLSPADDVMEVGVGTGTLAIDVGGLVKRVRGIDLSPDMVRRAQLNARAARSKNVTFEVADLLEYDAGEVFDVVLSNSTMHWILPAERAYQQLFRLLRHGGRLAVHQGGHGNYRGLRHYTNTVIRNLGYGQYFQTAWRYPTYYPTADDYRDLLERVGFVDVAVESAETDGSESPNLIRDFSEAGLLPYLNRLPETYQDSFRAEWLADAQESSLDLYTHRLYAVASRP